MTCSKSPEAVQIDCLLLVLVISAWYILFYWMQDIYTHVIVTPELLILQSTSRAVPYIKTNYISIALYVSLWYIKAFFVHVFSQQICFSFILYCIYNAASQLIIMFNLLQPTCNIVKFICLERVLISFCFQPNTPVI